MVTSTKLCNATLVILTTAVYLYFQIYAWPLLETLFSEVLTKDEWLMLFDNVFSNHPSFLLMVVAAYAMCARGPLMQCVELDDFKVQLMF